MLQKQTYIIETNEGTSLSTPFLANASALPFVEHPKW